MTTTTINNFMVEDNEENMVGSDHLRIVDNESAHDRNESPSFYTPAHCHRGGNNKNYTNYHVFYSFIENQLIESVKASLNHELFSNATFLCERLYAMVQNEDVKHLLA